jgi:uncharacterized membrane protein (DUF106 family)
MNIALIEIIIAGIAYALFSFGAQKKLANLNKVYEIRSMMSQEQKKLMELIKSNAPKTEIDDRQKHIMSMMSESMKYQIKGMIVVIPLFFIIYYYLLPMGFSSSNISIMLFSINLNYQNIFLITSFIFGMLIFVVYSRIAGNRAKATQPVPQNNV